MTRWVATFVLTSTAAFWGCSSGNGEDARQANDGPSGEAVDSDVGSSSSGGSFSTSSGGSTSSGAPLITDGLGEGAASASGGAAPTDDEPEPLGTNPFVVVSHDPLSTFAADVDTASYDIFRRDVGAGSLPLANSVRLEEYVNYFKYYYDAPAEDAEHPFALSLEAAPSVMNDETTLVRIGIQGVLPPAFEKKPTNLVFLVDTSGSMQQQNKLPLVQYTLTQTLDVLDPADTVSIVTYAGEAGVALEPTAVSQDAKIKAVIESLVSGGSTNGAGGINEAYEQAEAGFIQDGINHVILCTDGDFNVGISDTDELVDLITEKRKSGVTLTALGYGDVSNDAMMERVSNAGNGNYSVITSESQAQDYVEDRLLSAITLIAKDMKIQVEFNPDLVYAYRLLGYEDRAIADNDFRNDVVDAGEIGAGHQVTALYELVPAGGNVPNVEGAPEAEDGAAYDGVREVSADDLVLVKIRYKDVDAGETDPAYEVGLGLPAANVAEDEADTDPSTQWAIAIASFAEILKQSPYADANRISAIQKIVTRNKDRDEDRQEFAGLFTTALGLLGN
jgi:Ca-activated chloride channel homolog